MGGERTVTIPRWAQGRPGMGQGGWCAATFEDAIGEPVTIDFRSAIPLEEPMVLRAVEGGWELRHEGRLVMAARLRDIPFTSTSPVTIDAAARASQAFLGADDDHDAPACFSCGVSEPTMGIRPGPLEDGTGRVACPWVPPAWVCSTAGVVERAVVSTVMDCTQGFFVGHLPARRQALTARYAVEVLGRCHVGERYAIVAYDGAGNGWDGRKRMAAAAVFDAAGQLVARADSLWVEPRPA